MVAYTGDIKKKNSDDYSADYTPESLEMWWSHRKQRDVSTGVDQTNG